MYTVVAQFQYRLKSRTASAVGKVIKMSAGKRGNRDGAEGQANKAARIADREARVDRLEHRVNQLTRTTTIIVKNGKACVEAWEAMSAASDFKQVGEKMRDALVADVSRVLGTQLVVPQGVLPWEAGALVGEVESAVQDG